MATWGEFWGEASLLLFAEMVAITLQIHRDGSAAMAPLGLARSPAWTLAAGSA